MCVEIKLKSVYWQTKFVVCMPARKILANDDKRKINLQHKSPLSIVSQFYQRQLRKLMLRKQILVQKAERYEQTLGGRVTDTDVIERSL